VFCRDFVPRFVYFCRLLFLLQSSIMSDSDNQHADASSDLNAEGTHQPGGDSKLFVGQLPPQFTAEMLRGLFAPYGELKDVVILINHLTGRHKGCGFVTYATRESAEAAIANLNGQQKLPNAKKEIVVRYAGIRPANEQKENQVDQSFKLYVCMLSKQSTEDDIAKLFSQYGDVKEVHLLRHADTGSSKGCAFVKFATKPEALRAISSLHDQYRDGLQAPGKLQVRFAHTEAEKIAKRNRHYAMGMLGVPMMNHMMGSPGFPGFNMPNSPAYASNAYQPAMMPPQMPLGPQGFGSFNHNPAGSNLRGPPGANLFVYNIPDGMSDPELLQLFAPYGTILSAHVFCDKLTHESKGYGFVSFGQPGAAQIAIQQMDGQMVGDKKLSVRVKKGDMEMQGIGLGGQPSHLSLNMQPPNGFPNSPPNGGNALANAQPPAAYFNLNGGNAGYPNASSPNGQRFNGYQ